jgi:quercetin dioxygenase-like cupin family protein
LRPAPRARFAYQLSVTPEHTKRRTAIDAGNLSGGNVHLLPRTPSAKGPEQWFTGDAYMNVLFRAETPPRTRVNIVRFTPGARSVWHSHSRGQTLHITEGVGLVQVRGEQVVVLRPGDVVWSPPGEEHWHGAAPDQFMSHTAIWDGEADGSDTTWGEPVSDEEYGYPDGHAAS